MNILNSLPPPKKGCLKLNLDRCLKVNPGQLGKLVVSKIVLTQQLEHSPDQLVSTLAIAAGIIASLECLVKAKTLGFNNFKALKIGCVAPRNSRTLNQAALITLKPQVAPSHGYMDQLTKHQSGWLSIVFPYWDFIPPYLKSSFS